MDEGEGGAQLRTDGRIKRIRQPAEGTRETFWTDGSTHVYMRPARRARALPTSPSVHVHVMHVLGQSALSLSQPSVLLGNTLFSSYF